MNRAARVPENRERRTWDRLRRGNTRVTVLLSLN